MERPADEETVDDGTCQKTEPTGDALMADKSATKNHPPTRFKDPSCPSQAGECRMQEEQVEAGALWQSLPGRKQNRDRPERADDILHQIKKKAGNREIQHRVEKH